MLNDDEKKDGKKTNDSPFIDPFYRYVRMKRMETEEEKVPINEHSLMDPYLRGLIIKQILELPPHDGEYSKTSDSKVLDTNFYSINAQENTARDNADNYPKVTTDNVARNISENLQLLSGWRKVNIRIKSTNEWEEFVFNEIQSKIVEELFNAPCHELHIKTLFEKIERSEREKCRMDRMFKNHPNWRSLIKKSTSPKKRGFWYLDI